MGDKLEREVMTGSMKEDECRIIKIDRDAVYEFIYENFVAQHKELMDFDAVGYSNDFAIDWESGAFIFTAHKSEDDDGNIISFPKDINLEQILKKIPATTDSVLNPGENYRGYSFKELRSISRE